MIHLRAFAIIVCVHVLAAPATAKYVTVREDGNAIVAADAGAELRFTRAGGGLRLAGASVNDAQVLRGPSVIWSAEFRDAEGRRALLHGGIGEATAREAEIQPAVAPYEAVEGVELGWTGLELPSGGRPRVTVRVEMLGDLRWRISFDDIPDDWTLFRYTFPILSLAAEPGDDCALIEPNDWGTITPDPLRNLESIRRAFPSGSAAMPFYALQDGDTVTYVGCHDPEARLKDFLISAHPAGERLRFAVQHPTRIAYGQDFEQDYPFVWQTLEGDWYDAALLYRQWALQAHPRTTTIPRDFIETPVVLMRLGSEVLDPTFVADWAIRMREWFGTPITQHYYAWHHDLGSMSIDAYPHFFPARPGFEEAVSRMEGAGVRVMPYLNARLWRTDVESWQEQGSSAAVRDPYGRIHEEVWMAIPAAVMTPATELWRSVISDQVVKLAEIGCSGVYLDQLGASPPHPDYDPMHPGPPGDTATWRDGYDQMLRDIRTRAAESGERFAISMEGCADPWVAAMDTCLTGNLCHERAIPLFSAVYHDRVLSFGRYVMLGDLELPKAALAKFAQQFVFGAQIGWSNAPLERFIAEQPAEAECLRKMARLRHAFPKLLAMGMMLRPPDLDDQVPDLTLQWYRWNKPVDVTLPQVLASAWQATDRAAGVLLVNIGDGPATVALDSWNATGTEATLARIGDNGYVSTETVVGADGAWTVTVPALEPVLLTVEGAYGSGGGRPGGSMRMENPREQAGPPTIEPADVLPWSAPEELAGARASADFPFRFEADALPIREQVWSMSGPGAWHHGRVASAVDGVLTIDTMAADAGALVVRSPRGWAWDVDPMRGWTVEARLRVTDCNSNERFAFWLQANTPDTLTTLQVFPDRITAPGVEPISADMASDFRVVRLVGMPGGELVRVYLDGAVIAEAPVLRGMPEQSQVALGAGASAGRVRAEVDFVRFAPTAAWAPPQ